MHILAGTSGYSYKEWKGAFYPDDIKPPDMLSYYATQLPTVEINNTFYRMPRRDVLEAWADAVGDDFRFSIKASRRITHIKRLREAGEETTYLLDAVQTLGSKLGVVLFQLPPNFKKDMERMAAFLELLGEDVRAVFEFRHESWVDDGVFDLLKKHGCAVCLSDVDDEPPPRLVPTADWGYLRLRRMEYSKKDLAGWLERIGAQPWKQTFVFFKHEDEAAGPLAAKEFMEMAGV